jgi:hypothetical protein
VEVLEQQFRLGKVTVLCVLICKGDISSLNFHHHNRSPQKNERRNEDSDLHKTASSPLELCRAHSLLFEQHVSSRGPKKVVCMIEVVQRLT